MSNNQSNNIYNALNGPSRQPKPNNKVVNTEIYSWLKRSPSHRNGFLTIKISMDTITLHKKLSIIIFCLASHVVTQYTLNL
uniref:Uncharacterized protein n=1 Tax=Romanomermis culicivorax TaxID=13658 RepID=A0A915KAB7_ROMCU